MKKFLGNRARQRNAKPGIGFMAWLLLGGPGLVSAQTDGTHPTYALDFSLQFSRIESTLEAAGNTYPTDLKRISVTMLEPIRPNLALGLVLGDSYLSLENHSPSAGLNPAGFTLGLMGRHTLAGNPAVTIQGHILYQRLHDNSATTDVDLDWLEWQLLPSLRLDLGSDWGISFGVGYTGVDAEQRLTGASNQSLQLKRKQPIHGVLELELLTAGDGRVSLAVSQGGQQGMSLDFARRF